MTRPTLWSWKEEEKTAGEMTRWDKSGIPTRKEEQVKTRAMKELSFSCLIYLLDTIVAWSSYSHFYNLVHLSVPTLELLSLSFRNARKLVLVWCRFELCSWLHDWRESKRILVDQKSEKEREELWRQKGKFSPKSTVYGRNDFLLAIESYCSPIGRFQRSRKVKVVGEGNSPFLYEAIEREPISCKLQSGLQ